MTNKINKDIQVDVLSKNQKFVFYILLLFWGIANVMFFLWWFDNKHIASTPLFILNTITVLWVYLLPAYFFYFVLRMKKPNPDIEPPANLRVAMVVTRAPSEPFELIKKTLNGMIDQDYPHHVWIADEDPTEEIKEYAQKHGILISSRKGIPEYNRDTWPRRTKCKEGNLAYFYDTYGYEKYDVVVQLDADHIPQKDYLKNMLTPFHDPKVGYVSAPSICSNNASNSWSARARLYIEGPLHGAQQAGHSNGYAPLCFGSHYAVRTKALKEIGGLGPELAEDHSTTLIMNAHGWKGMHALDAHAIGDGPETFADAMTQEFQWSRSLMNVLLMWTPKYISGLPPRLKFEFVFSQLWYVFYAFIMLLGFMSPMIALVLNKALASVSYVSFFFFAILNLLTTVSIVMFLRRLKLFRPVDAKIFSWEVLAFQLARWPWVLFGVCSSLYDFVLKREFKFKVTPKDRTGYVPLPIGVLVPYIIIMLLYLVFGLFVPDSTVTGYYYFIMTGLILYLFTLATIIYKHDKEQQ